MRIWPGQCSGSAYPRPRCALREIAVRLPRDVLAVPQSEVKDVDTLGWERVRKGSLMNAWLVALVLVGCTGAGEGTSVNEPGPTLGSIIAPTLPTVATTAVTTPAGTIATAATSHTSSTVGTVASTPLATNVLRTEPTTGMSMETSTLATGPRNTEALMQTVVDEYYKAYLGCGQAPSSCDPKSFTAPDSKMRAAVTNTVRALSEAGQYFAEDSRGSFMDVRVAVIWGDVAAVEVCHFDAGLVLGPAGQDGFPVVVDGSIRSSLSQLRLRRVDARWMVAGGEELENLGMGQHCLPRRFS